MRRVRMRISMGWGDGDMEGLIVVIAFAVLGIACVHYVLKVNDNGDDRYD